MPRHIMLLALAALAAVAAVAAVAARADEEKPKPPNFETTPVPIAVALAELPDDAAKRAALRKSLARRLGRRARVEWGDALTFTMARGQKVSYGELRKLVALFGRKHKLKGLRVKDVQLKGKVLIVTRLPRKPSSDDLFRLTLEVQSMDGVRLLADLPRGFARFELMVTAPGSAISELDFSIAQAMKLEEDTGYVTEVVWYGPPRAKR